MFFFSKLFLSLLLFTSWGIGFYRYKVPNVKFIAIKKVDKKEVDFLSSIKSPYSEDIKKIASSRFSIIRYIDFNMPVEKKVYTDVFERLDYAVTMIRKYVRSSSFSISNHIKNGENYYSSYDGYGTYAPLMEHVYTSKSDTKDRFVFYIEGFYDGTINLEGKMLIDVELIKLVNKGEDKTRILIKNYVYLTSGLLRMFAPLVVSSNSKKVNRMIEGSIKLVLYQGVKASYGIKRTGCNLSAYLKNKDYLLNKYVYRPKD